MAEFYNRKRVKDKDGNPIYTSFKEGDKVWLDGHNLKTYRPSKKLDVKRLGPFLILEKIGKSAYRLRLPRSWNRIHPVFNEVLLTTHSVSQYQSQIQPEPPGPIDMEGHPEYEVINTS